MVTVKKVNRSIRTLESTKQRKSNLCHRKPPECSAVQTVCRGLNRTFSYLFEHVWLTVFHFALPISDIIEMTYFPYWNFKHKVWKTFHVLKAVPSFLKIFLITYFSSYLLDLNSICSQNKYWVSERNRFTQDPHPLKCSKERS